MISTEIDLDGAFNARAIGQPSPWIVRSSALDALTADGVETLRSLGVARVIDLRAPGEGGTAAHDIDVLSMPLYRPDAPVPVAGRIESILDGVLSGRGRELAAIIAVIADSSEPVAVHCTIGKDRTGLVVALALLAAGATEEETTADYVLSGPAVLPHRRDLVESVLSAMDLSDEELAEAWRLNVESPSEAIQHVYDRLRAWGGAAEYLRQHGLTANQLTALRRRYQGV